MEVLRYSAFTKEARGGNPAGVVLDARGLSSADMAAIAKEVGYSETAFVLPAEGPELEVRYFSPAVEVPFCGHATIATAVAYAQLHGTGDLTLSTKAGIIGVRTQMDAAGWCAATLTSVPPRTAEVSDAQVEDLLAILGWDASELDPDLAPRAAYAGAWHVILAAATRSRLAHLDYDVPKLTRLMEQNGWVTVSLVWRESGTVFHARNPFPTGGVFEDPATGAAAAALGGYLRERRLIPLPAEVTVLQGHDMGRPSSITVTIPEEQGTGIGITGTAVPI
ncbi:PhzF family phenazine biosynthesis protein [Streptomyces parvulus]|uniref:PhzF family phenazine biosynthesis protein n=1 Tax=Streptomyces parvulus TaxID=146923 RepID=UPI0037D02E6A